MQFRSAVLFQTPFRKQAYQFILGIVSILKLIDKNVLEAIVPALQHMRILLEQLHAHQQHVVKIHRVVAR